MNLAPLSLQVWSLGLQNINCKKKKKRKKNFDWTEIFVSLVQGIYEGDNCPKDGTGTNHVVLIVGYDSVDGEDYWIVKNSWGQKWGINGYIFIRRNTDLPYGVCAINAWAYYPTKKNSTLSQTISSL